MLALILLIVSLVVNLCVGLLVFLKNPRSVLHLLLTALIVSMSLWLVLLRLSDARSDLVLFWNRAVFVAPLAMALLSYLFIDTLAGKKLIAKAHIIATVGTLAVSALVLSGATIEDALPRYVGSAITGYDVVRGFAYYPVALWMVGLGYMSIYGAFQGLKRARSSYKAQMRVILLGIVLCVSLSVFTNLLVPLALGNSSSAQYAPLATIALSVSFSYAILRHQFLNIRAVVARSVAYILIISTMTAAYAIILFGIINVLFDGPNHEFLRQMMSLVVVAPLAISFQVIKKFFDRITNKLFYRDGYDTQDVLDNIGNVVVSEINLDKIIENTKSVLMNALKASFVEVILVRGEEQRLEMRNQSKAEYDLKALIRCMKDQSKELVVVDDLSYDNRLRKAFLSSGVALSLRLKTQDQIVGYVVFGDKLSGDVYSTQDKDLLSIVANELAVTIQNALRFDEIEHFNATLQRKVVEATSKLRRSNIKLRALDEAKDEFVGLASHQLRTPLTSVKGYISMLLEGDAGEITPMQRKLLQEAFTSSERMVHLIGDFLNVSRLQTGKFMLEVRPIDLAKLVSEEVTSLESTAKAHGLKLRYRAPSHFPILYLDEGKIRQVVMNFIDNAIYYSDEETSIDISLNIEDGDAVMRVKDTGIGVPVAEQAHLFTKFYRASNARKQRPDGTGVGIFLAKKVAIAHGGSVVFSSTEGKGSTFGLRLPVAPLSQPSADEPIAV